MEEIIGRLRAVIQLLARQPGLGRFRPERAPFLESFAADSYLIVFRMIPTGIEVVRIIHSAMNITPSTFRR